MHVHASCSHRHTVPLKPLALSDEGQEASEALCVSAKVTDVHAEDDMLASHIR